MVAPKAPEGGWKKWFLDHPYQRTRYPIIRAENVLGVFKDPGNIPAPSSFEYVEMYWNPKQSKVFASLDGGPSQYIWFPDPDALTEANWTKFVEDLFNYVMDGYEKQKDNQPEPPQATGWDDFDWST